MKIIHQNQKINIASIDQQLAKQGSFCLIDWLLEESLLLYADYENWRYEKIPSLEEVIQVTNDCLSQLIKSTNQHCNDLGLITEQQKFFSWSAQQGQQLAASSHAKNNEHLTQRWIRSQDLPQMDLFMDNSAQVAEQELVEVLAGRQFEKAQLLLDKLSKLNSACTRLGGYQDLIHYGMHMLNNATIAAEELGDEVQGLKLEVFPLAQEVLVQKARDYLAFAWRRLASNMLEKTFDPENPDLHQSSALLQIPDYTAVVTSLIDNNNYLQHPQLIHRLAESYAALHQVENALITYCLLIENDSVYAEDALDDSEVGEVQKLWQDFWELNDDWSIELFPAYVLAKQRGLIHQLNQFPSLENSATQAMVNLQRQQLQGQDEISQRKALQEISPELLNIYLTLS